jgi:hypothetical protein
VIGAIRPDHAARCPCPGRSCPAGPRPRTGLPTPCWKPLRGVKVLSVITPYPEADKTVPATA